MPIKLSSPAFSNGDPIPEQYGYTRQNINPPLVIDGVPETARSLVLIMDDPDAREPAGKIWDHWLIWNIEPATGKIPEDWDGDGATEGNNDYGESGYGGPNPPDGKHTYYFKLYALDTELDLSTGASKDQLAAAMDGHILEQAELTGTFAP